MARRPRRHTRHDPFPWESWTPVLRGDSLAHVAKSAAHKVKLERYGIQVSCYADDPVRQYDRLVLILTDPCVRRETAGTPRGVWMTYTYDLCWPPGVVQVVSPIGTRSLAKRRPDGALVLPGGRVVTDWTEVDQ